MYLDNYDHKVLDVAADMISKKAGVSKTKARMMMLLSRKNKRDRIGPLL